MKKDSHHMRIIVGLIICLLTFVTGCDAFRPFNPAVTTRNLFNQPTPHIGVPRPGIDDDRPWPYDGFTAGPFFKDVETFNGGRIVSALGPAIRYEERPDTTKRIYIPLLFSYGERLNPLTGFKDKRARFLWPLGLYAETKRETKFVLYPILWIKKKRYMATSKERERTMVDIKFAAGIISLNFDSKDGTTGGILPLFGVFKHFLGREKLTLYFPLIGKFEGGGYTSWFYPWPLIGHWNSDDGNRTGRQFMPFYKVDDNKGKWFKRTILWPFWLEYHSQLDSSNPMKTYALFPFYMRRISKTRVQHSILLLFNFYERKQKDPDNPDPAIIPRKEYSFWPFVRYSKGPDVFGLTLWPLFQYRSSPRLSFFTLGPGREIFFPIGFVLNLYQGGKLFEMEDPTESVIPATTVLYEWERVVYRDYLQKAHRWMLFAYHINHYWYEKMENGNVRRRAVIPKLPPPADPVPGELAPDRAEGFAMPKTTEWTPKSDTRSLVWPLWRYDRLPDGAWRFTSLRLMPLSDPGQVVQSHYGFLWELFTYEAPACSDRRLRALFGTVRADWGNGYSHHGVYPLYDYWTLAGQKDRMLFSLVDGIVYRHYTSPLTYESGNAIFRYRSESLPAVNSSASQAPKSMTTRKIRRWEVLWGLIGWEKETYVRKNKEFRPTKRLRIFWTSLGIN